MMSWFFGINDFKQKCSALQLKVVILENVKIQLDTSFFIFYM